MSPPVTDRSFVKFLQEEKLMGSKCMACDAVFLPPRAFCVHCHRAEMNWVPMKGIGKLTAFTSIAIGPPFMIKQGFDRHNPYCTAVIELAEGPRVVARIEGVDALRPENIKIGMALKVKFLPKDDDETGITPLTFTAINGE